MMDGALPEEGTEGGAAGNRVGMRRRCCSRKAFAELNAFKMELNKIETMLQKAGHIYQQNILGEVSPRAQHHRAVLGIRQAPPSPLLRVLSLAYARYSARRFEEHSAGVYPRVEQGDVVVCRGLRQGNGGLPQTQKLRTESIKRTKYKFKAFQQKRALLSLCEKRKLRLRSRSP